MGKYLFWWIDKKHFSIFEWNRGLGSVFILSRSSGFYQFRISSSEDILISEGDLGWDNEINES